MTNLCDQGRGGEREHNASNVATMRHGGGYTSRRQASGRQCFRIQFRIDFIASLQLFP